ncbi:MAG: hypothetical protein F4081_07190 [Dehalococcoidia bacterium]|nr:hypothetical protein [Dehalococcoidia bacterium]
MPEQYVATDKRTGLEVAVTGEFPPHHDDRIRIARTCTLFTRLLATILSNTSESDRREQFVAIETQLEVAEALIRGDLAEVQRLLQQTMERMGLGPDELDEVARRILKEFGEDGPPDLGNIGDVRPDSQLPPLDDIDIDLPPDDGSGKDDDTPLDDRL